MVGYDAIDRNPSFAARARFGGTFVLFAVVAFAAIQLRTHDTRRAALVAAVLVGGAIVSLLPVVGRWFYVAWLALGVTIGKVTGPVVLAVLYALVFTPIAWWLRVRGRDAMKRTYDPSAKTYWEGRERPSKKSDAFRQW